MTQRRKPRPTPLTIGDIRTAVAQMLVLAIRSERYIGRAEKSPQGGKALKKLERIAKALKPLSDRKKSWLHDMHVGAFIDIVHAFYEKIQKKITTKERAKEFSYLTSSWDVMFRNPLTPEQLHRLFRVTSARITRNRGPGETAKIDVGRILGYKSAANKPSSHVEKIYRRYKRHKMAGLVHGVETGFSHVSFKEEPTWRFLLGYCFQNLMGISQRDSISLLNHIGDLLTKRIPRGVPPGG